MNDDNIGQINPNGTLEIIDRKKDLWKGPSGEYVALTKAGVEMIMHGSEIAKSFVAMKGKKATQLEAKHRFAETKAVRRRVHTSDTRIQHRPKKVFARPRSF